MRTRNRILAITAVLAAPLLALANPSGAAKGDDSAKAGRAPCPTACNCPSMSAAKASRAVENPYWTDQTWKYQ